MQWVSHVGGEALPARIPRRGVAIGRRPNHRRSSRRARGRCARPHVSHGGHDAGRGGRITPVATGWADARRRAIAQNPRHEGFRQARAAGAGLGAAYTAATPPGKPKPASPGSAKSMAIHWPSAMASARIQHLLAERRAGVLSSLDLTRIQGLADAADIRRDAGLPRSSPRRGRRKQRACGVEIDAERTAARSIAIGKSVRGDAVRAPSGATLQPISMPSHNCDCDANDR